MALYKVTDNTDTVFASDVDQFADALAGANDIGSVTLFSQISAPSAPTVAVNAIAGNLSGAYAYRIAFVTGYWKGQVGTGTIQIQGNTSGGTISGSVSPASQQINLTAIPVGPTGTIARIIYRTKSGGSTYFQVTQINDNTTTAYSDNTADTSLTITMPGSNTTGTGLTIGGFSVTSLGSVTVASGQTLTHNGTFAGSAVLPISMGGTGSSTKNFVDTTAYTASDVLTKIKTVDGSGSGLDADTVRGYVPVDQGGSTLTGKDHEIMRIMGVN